MSETPRDNTESLFPDYESFTRRGTPYNNFFLRFVSHGRKDRLTQLFEADHPHVSVAIRDVIINKMKFEADSSRTEWKNEVEPLLYVAYRFMERYAEVQERLKSDKYFLVR